ncbi:MAG: hypothetical protein AB1589_07000 [Cyanobacteriota bacterium]
MLLYQIHLGDATVLVLLLRREGMRSRYSQITSQSLTNARLYQ